MDHDDIGIGGAASCTPSELVLDNDLFCGRHHDWLYPISRAIVSMIYSLEHQAATDVRIAGGKAAALATLLAANFPVPEGFVVTTAAEPDLAEHLDSLEKRIGPVFAVRSSGYSEDSAHSSFAGQYETVLGVRGFQQISEAIARCFASFLDTRSAFYRESLGAVVLGGAVMVQRMIEADAAGVAFTVDPVTGASDRILIESNFGVGDSVAGGHVNPDGFTVTKKTGQVIERRISEKRVRSLLTSGGSVLVPMPEDFVSRPSLPDQGIRAVADLARRAEQRLGMPLDIEWAWKEEKVWLLQARAVTTSKPESTM